MDSSNKWLGKAEGNDLEPEIAEMVNSIINSRGLRNVTAEEIQEAVKEKFGEEALPRLRTYMKANLGEWFTPVE